MQTIGLTALFCFALGTSAMADELVPEEYQGVWAAARGCEENFQNILSTTVDRTFAACRVMDVQRAGRPESHTSTIYLYCDGSKSREIWHSENIDDADYLVIVQLDRGTAERPSIDVYKRCPGIPFSQIPLSRIPGDPVAEAKPEEKASAPPRRVQIVRQRPVPHSRATRMRKHGTQ